MSERQDIYDANRLPRGYTRARGDALMPGEFIVAVGIWVINSRGQVLITRRDPAKRFAPGKWENTGGHLMAGEEPRAAVLRELYEETGLRADADAVEYLGMSCSPPYFGDEFAVHMDADISRVKLQPGETCDARYVSRDELYALIDSGEMAPSVGSHLAQYRAAFERALAAGGDGAEPA